MIGILGYGNVASGVRQILECLPHRYVSPWELPSLVTLGTTGDTPDAKTVLLTVFKENDLVQRKDGAPFELQDYYRHPEAYESRFLRFFGISPS